mgnify:CR=1 FL=1
MWEEQIPLSKEPIDSRAFRDALGGFPTGVCLITMRRPDGKCEGLTVSSFNSVSLAPPLVLWSLTRDSPSADAFLNSKFFAINLLAADQQEVSNHFARRAVDKFAAFQGAFDAGLGGAPVLRDAVAVFECRNAFQTYGGDHIVFLAAVERFKANLARAPLVFARGRYAGVSNLHT